jgi:hypothetical protein
VSFHIHRLEQSIPVAWNLFPLYEIRVIEFLRRYKIDADPEMFRAQLRARFFDSVPDRHRMYLAVDDDYEHPVAHFLAWLDVAWNRPYIHINQVEGSEKLSINEFIPPVLREVDEWAEALNRSIPPGHPARVDTVSWFTWHDPTVFARWLRPECDLKISRYVLEYSISERRAARESEARERLN